MYLYIAIYPHLQKNPMISFLINISSCWIYVKVGFRRTLNMCKLLKLCCGWINFIQITETRPRQVSTRQYHKGGHIPVGVSPTTFSLIWSFFISCGTWMTKFHHLVPRDHHNTVTANFLNTYFVLSILHRDLYRLWNFDFLQLPSWFSIVINVIL